VAIYRQGRIKTCGPHASCTFICRGLTQRFRVVGEAKPALEPPEAFVNLHKSGKIKI